jgi:hypothetical protein
VPLMPGRWIQVAQSTHVVSMSDLSRRATAPAARGTFLSGLSKLKIERKGDLVLRTVRVFRRVTLWQRDAPMRLIG